MNVRRFDVNKVGRDIAVGDIHAHFSHLQKELDRIQFDTSVDRLFLVGDLVDRGPENHSAYDWLYKDWVFSVRGNHDSNVAKHATNVNWIKSAGAWFSQMSFYARERFAEPFKKLPIAIEIETPNGKVGIIHASCDYDSWEELVKYLEADKLPRVFRKTLFSKCLYSRVKFENKDDTEIKDVKALVVGHNPVNDMLVLGNTYYIDTQGWKPGVGKFTLLDLHTLQVL